VPSKELLIVGGPNGSGKSTFVAAYLDDFRCPYLCADSIAKEPEFQRLEPWALSIAAGREFIERIERQLTLDEDFIVETTMSGRSLRNFLLRAKKAEFSITIFFVYLNSPDTCIARVRQRVRRGGHHVPEDDIRRRFSRSLANFWQIYREIADYWYVVYNSETDYEWIASGDPESTVAHNAVEFDWFLKMAGAEND